MYILQYMDDSSSFWKCLYFAKGNENELLDKYSEMFDAGFVVRVFIRCNVNEIKKIVGGNKK